MHINNKYNIGDTVYRVVEETSLLPTTEICNVCSGDKEITYNNYTFTCPKCGGKGIIVSGNNRTDLYKVSEPKAITSMRVDVKHDNNMTIIYRVGYDFCKENELFTDLSDAEDCCKLMNEHRAAEVWYDVNTHPVENTWIVVKSQNGAIIDHCQYIDGSYCNVLNDDYITLNAYKIASWRYE